MKNLKLIVWPNTKLKAKVEFIPRGNKITWRIQGKVCCSKCGHHEIRKSGTWYKDDICFNVIFGSPAKIEKFLKHNRKIYKVIPINQLNYDPCDYIK
jgi:hypothetical protein